MRNHRQVEAACQLGLVNAGSNTLYFPSLTLIASKLDFKKTKNNHHKRGLLYPLNPTNPLFGDDHYALLPKGLVTGLVSGDKGKVVMELFEV